MTDFTDARHGSDAMGSLPIARPCTSPLTSQMAVAALQACAAHAPTQAQLQLVICLRSAWCAVITGSAMSHTWRKWKYIQHE
ncbi:hypothetical protein [Stenotrophomonas pavanii]|uniref:hypothetical protein n=1 Tax=Stenotrophomonas pavanii TaxID=487698 RepID=UPI0039C6DC6E